MWRSVISFGLGLALAQLALGCVGYHAGVFRLEASDEQPPYRHNLQLGCLDVGVGLHDISSPGAPVVRFGLGNRCGDRIRVDLAAVRVEGRDHTGNRITLAPVDAPWMRPRELGARWFAREIVRYAPAARPGPPLHEICVEVTGGHPSPSAERWTCMSIDEVSS